ncbi:MAG: hydroxymethylbilane synthase [Desulfobacterota bacterium]|jgi:hydroxymethylbilane synthase|nr:hydroxymethylbilane synthase [Thermodesulfobacteriota bacterium]
MRTIRIGTRGSALALAQTEMVRSALRDAAPQAATEIITVRTTGDILADAPLDAIGGKGVFVKDIECRLLENRIDMAVHSLKDMQAILPESLSIGAFLPREDPRDMLFSCGGHSLDSLPPGSRIGTSSMRRRCQLRQVRPDLVVVDIRGNVTTRLGKVGASVDAVILAAAGVIRLGLPLGIAMDPGTMIPSPGQGIIAVECRAQDQEISEILAALDHAPTRACAEAERAFLATLGQDCNLPAGALAEVSGTEISMAGMLGSTDEACCVRMMLRGLSPSVGRLLARKLQERIHKEEEP